MLNPVPVFFAAAPAGAPFQAERIYLEETQSRDAGIRYRYPIERGAWLWHPESADQRVGDFVLFRLRFSAPANAPTLRLHVSADQRYELALDGLRVGAGPEAAASTAYSFSSYAVDGLTPGEHVLEVFCWHAGRDAPIARETVGPGFVLAAEDAWHEEVSTGSAAWEVCRLDGLRLNRERRFKRAFGIGLTTVLDARAFPWTEAQRSWRNPAHLTVGRDEDILYGTRQARWRLHPARLPEMVYAPVSPGHVKAVVDDFVAANVGDQKLHAFSEADGDHAAIPDWQACWAEGTNRTIGVGEAVSVLIDLEDYYCGYPEVVISGGAGAEIAVDWVESLVAAETALATGREDEKGDRNAFVGKSFRGLNDTFFADGGERRLRSHWWRSGRWLLVRVRAAEQPVTIECIQIMETRYPYQWEGTFRCDQDDWLDPVKKICRRGLEMCSHETYLDCPFYEQLMYVFDTRLEVLTTYALTSDDRLPRRAIELFDISRERHRGAACSRFPSREDQLIPMFSMAWTWMVRDHLYWRGHADWLQTFLPGVRATHDWFEGLENTEGLLEALPGWPYGDWVARWPQGVPAAARDGVSAVMNLLYALSLQSLADLERHLGDPRRAGPLEAKATALQARLKTRFYDADRGLVADDDSREAWSQHAQIWAALGGALSGEETDRALTVALEDESLAPASYFFRSLLFDALADRGRGDTVLTLLGAWQEMVALGARTGFEHQEPTRSDCHAWSSHPLYHLPATVAGIRPASPGFATVHVRPQPGDLAWLETTLPHPRGTITARMAFANGILSGHITLPDGVTGTLAWRGALRPLHSGENSL